MSFALSSLAHPPWQSRMNKPFHGGVGAFLTVAMVVAAVRAKREQHADSSSSDGCGGNSESGGSSGGSSGGNDGRRTLGSGVVSDLSPPADLGHLLIRVIDTYAHHELRLDVRDFATGDELGGAAWAWAPLIVSRFRSWRDALTTHGCLSVLLSGWPRGAMLTTNEALADLLLSPLRVAPMPNRGSVARFRSRSPSPGPSHSQRSQDLRRGHGRLSDDDEQEAYWGRTYERHLPQVTRRSSCSCSRSRSRSRTSPVRSPRPRSGSPIRHPHSQRHREWRF